MLRRAKTWAWIAFAIVCFAVVDAPSHHRFGGAILSSFAFAAVVTWLPKCRPVAKALLCPWNWALLVFAFQLIVLPLLINLVGPAVGVLPALPSTFAVNMAMVLNTLAFVTACVTYSCVASSRAAPDSGWLERLGHGTDATRKRRTRWVVLFGLFGLAGVFLSFGTFASLLEYFNDPAYYRERLLDLSSTLRGVSGTFLKPFLGFAVIMLWCECMDAGGKKDSSRLRRSIAAVLMLVGVVVCFSLFSYNRGAVAVPLIAVATASFAKGDKVAWRTILSVGLIVLILSPIYAVYRSGSQLGVDVLAESNSWEMLTGKLDIYDVVEMYGGAPQYLGFLLERTNWGAEPHWGTVTASSILSPVPVLGKSFRRESGWAVYNRMIYGTDAIEDQNVPFLGEAFLDLHITGVVLFFAMFGWVLSRLQRAFERSRSSLEIYIWQYLSVWICFLILWSVAVTSQVLVYFCWPIYLFWYLNGRKSDTPIWRLAVQRT